MTTRPAITYTIKNEERLLPDAIRYHRALGFERFYVFLDGTTDSMVDWLKRQPDVTLAESVDPDALEEPPEWIDWARENHADWMDVRRKLNLFSVARQARRDGFDWLAAIDPDELIVPEGGLDTPSPAGPWLDAVPPEVDQLLLPNLDVVPSGGAGRGPFDHRYFLNRLGVLEGLWVWPRRVLSRIVRRPELISWYDHLFFKIALAGRNPRVLTDPRTGRTIPFGYFLSYANHKPIVRTATAERFDPNIHGWRRKPGGPRPRSRKSGNVLHFDLIDAAHFAAKFHQRRGQQEFERKLFYPRWVIGRMAAELDRRQLARFFDESIAISDPQRLERLTERHILVRVDHVARRLYAEGPTAPPAASTDQIDRP